MIFRIFAVMTEIKTSAVVLRSVRYGDSQLIVDTFTEEAGRVSFICKLSKSPKGKFKKQLFQPMTFIDIVTDYRPRLRLQRFKDVRLAGAFVSIPTDPYKLSITMFLSEFLACATRDEQRNPPLYDFISKSMSWLDGASSRFANFHLVFMVRLLGFLGFFPNMDSYRSGYVFDLRNGVFTAAIPSHPDFMNAEDSGRMFQFMRVSYETMHLYTMSRMERNRCVEVILHYYKLHVPNFPELKSLEVLRELF